MSNEQDFPRRSDLLDLIQQLQDIADALPDAIPETQKSTAAALVTQAKLCEMTGYTPDRLDGMRRRGELIQGVHWFLTPQDKIDWDVEAFDKWRRGEQLAGIKASRSEMARSGSGSSTGGTGSMSPLTTRPALEVLRKRRSYATKSTEKADGAS